MEPNDPLSQLVGCCFGRRLRSSTNGGFRTVALRNQYYYSPSIAHMNAANTGTWPIGAQANLAGLNGPMFAAPAGLGPQAYPAQPYFLLTQPVIMAASPTTMLSQATTAGVQQQHQLKLAGSGGATQSGQVKAISYVNASPMHRVPSVLQSQPHTIYAANPTMLNGQQHYLANLPVQNSAIYDSPQQMNLARNTSFYLSAQMGAVTLDRTAQASSTNRSAHLTQRTPSSGLPYPMAIHTLPTMASSSAQGQQNQRRLNSEIFSRLDMLEKQADLSQDMDLVERNGMVITRSIEPSLLAPHLTDETLRRYQAKFVSGDENYVIRFIEIIKRPGQTLGLYIRAVRIENPRSRAVREGIVITKIESESPVYTSHVLRIGDEILSINLIDVQGMSLDDVVTLMSIPKRLVLALRIPRERDYLAQLESESRQESREQHQDYNKMPSKLSQENEFPHRHVMDDDLRARSQERQDDLPAGQSNLDSEATRQSVEEHEFQMDVQRSMMSTSSLQSHSQIQRVQSQTNGDQEVASLQFLGPRPDNFMTSMSNMTPTTATTSSQQAITRPLRAQSAIQMSDSLDDRLAREGDVNYGSGEQIEQHSNRLARSGGSMTTEVRPIASSQLHDSSHMNVMSANCPKRPVIDNLHLGDTPEQSSYFSSSIDAINRELRELRRQRMASSSNDHSVDEWEGIINELRS